MSSGPMQPRNRATSRLPTTVGALLLLTLEGATAAQVPSLQHSAIGGGGGPAAGGPYRIEMSSGFVEAPALAAPGSYRVRAGFAGQLNEAPTARDDTVNRAPYVAKSIPATALLGNDQDIEGDALMLNSVLPQSSGGGSVRISGNQVVYDPPPGNPSVDTLTYTVTDGFGLVSVGVVTLTAVPARVLGRVVFYGQSAWDTGNHDGAIATDKVALLPGVKAGFNNYTAYSRGVNGIMVDVAGLTSTPTTVDFQFKTGNSANLGSWVAAPAPASMTVRIGAGTGGSDRVTLTWGTDAVKKKWLQIRVLATARTGLAADDVFYFGNAIGETGNSPGVNAIVSATDEIQSRLHPRSAFSPASITDEYDFNRDKLVNATDQILARLNTTSAFTALQLITPVEAGLAVPGDGHPSDGGSLALGAFPAGHTAGVGRAGAMPSSPVAGSASGNPRRSVEAPAMTVSRLPDGRVRISVRFVGPATARGVGLEISSDPGSGAWEPVGPPTELAGEVATWIVAPRIDTSATFFRWSGLPVSVAEGK